MADERYCRTCGRVLRIPPWETDDECSECQQAGDPFTALGLDNCDDPDE